MLYISDPTGAFRSFAFSSLISVLPQPSGPPSALPRCSPPCACPPRSRGRRASCMRHGLLRVFQLRGASPRRRELGRASCIPILLSARACRLDHCSCILDRAAPQARRAMPGCSSIGAAVDACKWCFHAAASLATPTRLGKRLAGTRMNAHGLPHPLSPLPFSRHSGTRRRSRRSSPLAVRVLHSNPMRPLMPPWTLRSARRPTTGSRTAEDYERACWTTVCVRERGVLAFSVIIHFLRLRLCLCWYVAVVAALHPCASADSYTVARTERRGLGPHTNSYKPFIQTAQATFSYPVCTQSM
jgi:hypothetical protein